MNQAVTDLNEIIKRGDIIYHKEIEDIVVEYVGREKIRVTINHTNERTSECKYFSMEAFGKKIFFNKSHIFNTYADCQEYLVSVRKENMRYNQDKGIDIRSMLEQLLISCDLRYNKTKSEKHCPSCVYKERCRHDCGLCLNDLHFDDHSRKYDCSRMADYYTCRYSGRYTSEMIYAFQRLKGIERKKSIKVLSLGCGPCTDLLAIDYLKSCNKWSFKELEYRGIDYCFDVWENVHSDIIRLRREEVKIDFFYKDVCDFIEEIKASSWVPDLMVFQYFLSDLYKHSGEKIYEFIHEFAWYANNKLAEGSYIVLNGVNASRSRGGDRFFFDRLYYELEDFSCRKGRFFNENSIEYINSNSFRYGEESEGEFPNNSLAFDVFPWREYLPLKGSCSSCASAQMILRR